MFTGPYIYFRVWDLISFASAPLAMLILFFIAGGDVPTNAQSENPATTYFISVLLNFFSLAGR